jgi:hypothetical protein
MRDAPKTQRERQREREREREIERDGEGLRGVERESEREPTQPRRVCIIQR